jgi:hypothetical protein
LWLSRIWRCSAVCASGTHKSVDVAPHAFAEKRAGIMPTISYSCPLNSSVRPITRGSLPRCDFQNPSLMITTWGCPAVSSSGRNTRPALGGVRTTSKKSAPTAQTSIASGLPVPVSVNGRNA